MARLGEAEKKIQKKEKKRFSFIGFSVLLSLFQTNPSSSRREVSGAVFYSLSRILRAPLKLTSEMKIVSEESQRVAAVTRSFG